MAGIKHKFTSAVEDGADETLVRPSNWNADHEITGDVDFAKYKAIALACDSGATMPTSPATGQWFLHTPTGRNILYQYNGSAWISVISFGSMTVYVDKTDGTDDLNHGTAVDANAFATVQYAVDCIPGLVGGNVIIYVNAEDYDETVTIRGKNLTGNFTITLQGVLTQLATGTIESAVQGTGVTQGSITDTGEFTGYADKLLYANSEYRLIDSVTADVATIIGCWSGTPSGTWVIYDWGTSINKTIVQSGQQGIYLYDLSLDTIYGFTGTQQGVVTGYRLKIDTIAISNSAVVILNQSYVTSGSTIVIDVLQYAYLAFYSSKVYSTVAGAACIRAYSIGQLFFTQGSVLDAASITGTMGITCFGNSVVNCWSSAANGYPRIRNQATGITAYSGGQVGSTANNQYSGNTADETATAASFGYID